jgi:hypothetical protein
MSAPSVRWRIAVLDDDDRHMFWASESFAHELVREHKVTLIRRNNRTVALRSVAGAREEILELAGRGTALGGTSYTHHHETPENPPKVWTLKRLCRDQKLYNGVLLSLHEQAKLEKTA